MATIDEDLLLNIQLLSQIVVNESRHPYYERVTKLAKNYRAYVTGIGLDEMMERYAPREDEESFKQRKQITQHIIPGVVGNITSVERKVPRSNGKTRVLAYEEDQKYHKANELEKILSKYWGTMTLDDWMATRWIELNDVDPNTFVVVEWDNFDPKQEKPAPYPYESSSHDAVMFEYINNILQYLVDMKVFPTVDIDGNEVEAQKYTMYLMNQTIQAVQIFDKNIQASIKEDGELVDIDGTYYFRRNEKVYFQVKIMKPHKLGYVPAFRAGYKRDEATNGETFVSPYHDAVPYLQKTIKANSEMDLTMALHAFPQKIITARKCADPDCYGGYIRKEGSISVCKTCEGKGFDVHSSAQDIIFAPIPENPDEQLALDNMVRYITPEVALVEFQRTYLEYLTNECMQAVFNSDVFTKEEVATTATEKRIDLDNVYDTLYPLSVKFARVWEFQVKTISRITKTDKGLTARMTFSKDFKFKSKDDYIADRRAAKEAGVPDAILRNIDDEIMKIDTAENPEEFAIYRTIQSFDPFSGKSQEEIITAMASNTVPFEIKVLYDNMGWIFDEIFMEHPDFFMWDRRKQNKTVDDKVKELTEQLKKDNTTSPPDLG